MMHQAATELPTDVRARLGAWIFLASLVVFFVSSILLYGIYAWSRRDDPLRNVTLPGSFMLSTAFLVSISWMLHLASRAVRRDRWQKTSQLLGACTVAAIAFLVVQVFAMRQMVETTLGGTNGRGVVGMVVVLAFLHALHVAGGVVALGVVAVRASDGRYDHERHFAVDFSAQYWHFLDIVWLVMLATFWVTTKGF
jgi:cytochrome c oxidase subunit III